MQRSIIWPSFFLFTRKLTSYSNRLSSALRSTKPRSCGIGVLKMMRPAVVSTSFERTWPFTSSVRRTLMGACRVITPS